MPQPDYDSALKRLLLRAHDSVLDLVAPGVTWQSEVSPELPATARLADFAWEVTLQDGRRGIVHIELQTDPDPLIGERVAEYLIRLYRREHKHLRSVVIYLRPSEGIPPPAFIIPWGETATQTTVYTVIKLWDVPYQRILQPNDYAIWALVGLMAGATVETTIEVAERLATAPIPREDQIEFTSALLLLSGLRLPGKTILEALRRSPMIDDILKESSFAAALHDLLLEEEKDKWVEEGKERGIEEGRQRGIEEGRTGATKQATRVALEGRFGSLGPDVVAALEQASEQVLIGIIASFTTETLQQVRLRLGLPTV